MKKNALIIYNPKAGKNGAAHMLPYVVESLRKRKCRCVAWPTLPGYGCEEILADEEGKFDFVVCCGGDGTLNHAINGLMRLEEKPQLIYLPPGSTNDFAISLGLSKDIETACSKVEDTQPFYYDIGKFNKIYFNYVAAFGAFTQVSYTTPQEMKNQLGHAAYIIEGIRRLPIGQYHKRTVISEDRVLHGDFIYGSVSNSTSIGGMSLPVKNEVSMNDGLFEVFLIKAPKNMADLQSIITSILTQNFDNRYISYFKTRNVHFEFESPTPWTLDGEYGGDVTETHISVVNKAIGILK